MIKKEIDIKFNTNIEDIIEADEGLEIKIQQGPNIKTACVLSALGRSPNVAQLNLDKIEILQKKNGAIIVDEFSKTNIDHIYAIGDVIKGPMLAHKAEEEGIAVAEIIAGQSGHVNYDIIPGVVYTSPEVAVVGKTEEQLKIENIDYKVGKFPFLANSRAKVNNETDGFVKILADKKKHIYDEDIAALVDDSLIKEENVIKLKSLKVVAGTGEPQKAEMTLDVYGEIKSTSETGDGPVDAIFKCIKVLYPHDVKLQLYQVHAVTEGTDAQATVSVRIEEEGKTTVGQAADTDTLVASANAYLSALNKMIIKRKKTAPMEHETQKVKGI